MQGGSPFSLALLPRMLILFITGLKGGVATPPTPPQALDPPLEMGLMRGSKSLAFWGRGGPISLGGGGGGGGAQIAPTPVCICKIHSSSEHQGKLISDTYN